MQFFLTCSRPNRHFVLFFLKWFKKRYEKRKKGQGYEKCDWPPPPPPLTNKMSVNHELYQFTCSLMRKIMRRWSVCKYSWFHIKGTMETIYLSQRAQVAAGIFFMKSLVTDWPKGTQTYLPWSLWRSERKYLILCHRRFIYIYLKIIDESMRSIHH